MPFNNHAAAKSRGTEKPRVMQDQGTFRPFFERSRQVFVSLTAVAACALVFAQAQAQARAQAQAQAPAPAPAQAQESLGLSPTRPTIANSATVQNKGVLQVETGYDAYPHGVPGNQQTVDAAFFYTPLDRLRLDLTWSAYAHSGQGGQTVNGVGTLTLGGKIPIKKEQYTHRSPGFAIQYEAELPTASVHDLQGYGQQAILLMNKHLFGTDFILNGSLVQSNCRTPAGCTYGGQQSFAVSYHLNKETRLYAEAFGQNVSQSNTPAGTYVFSGFYHQLSEGFGLDGGVRFGVSDHAASVGTTVGIVVGRRLGGESASATGPASRPGPGPGFGSGQLHP